MNQAELKAYQQFRTGFTFNDIYQMLWVGSEDSKDWPKHNARNRRHAVLGKWREIKLQMWEDVKNMFQLEFEE